MDEPLAYVSALFEIFHVGLDVSADHIYVLRQSAVNERNLSGGTDELPLLAADKPNASPELTRDVAGVTVDGFEVLICITEDGLDMLRLH